MNSSYEVSKGEYVQFTEAEPRTKSFHFATSLHTGQSMRLQSREAALYVKPIKVHSLIFYGRKYLDWNG